MMPSMAAASLCAMAWRLQFWLWCMDAAHRLTGFSRVHLWFVRRASDCVDWEAEGNND